MSFKIFKFNCCGLDVHKTWIYACIGITDSNNRTEYKQARFSSFTKGLNDRQNTTPGRALCLLKVIKRGKNKKEKTLRTYIRRGLFLKVVTNSDTKCTPLV